MHKNLKTLISLLFLLILSLSVLAQEKKDNRKAKKQYYDWGSLGVGVGVEGMESTMETRSFAATYNHSFGKQKIFWQGNITGTLYGDVPSLFALNFAPGYAIGFRKPFLIALSIGAGYMTGFNENTFRYRAIGGNATVQFHFKPLNDFGLGLELFFNIPFAGNYSSLPSYNGARLVVAISQK